jgi:anti-sigma-K factor RskA
MNLTQHLSQEDLTLFALQLLEDAELTSALEHLEHCEQCRHDVARYQGDLVGYALAMSELHSPPAQARERLLRKVAKEKKVVAMPLTPASAVIPLASRSVASASNTSAPLAIDADPRNGHSSDGELFLASRGRRVFEADRAADDEPRTRGGAGAFLGWAGWAIAAGLAVVAGLQFRERQNLQNDFTAVSGRLNSTTGSLTDAQTALATMTDQGAMQVSLHVPVSGTPEPPKPEGHVAYNAQTGGLVFIAEHLAPVAAGKTYELWLIQPETNGIKLPPLPAGTFKPDDRGIAHLIMPELPKGTAAAAFGVTVEDDGGSSKPTLPIILAGM